MLQELEDPPVVFQMICEQESKWVCSDCGYEMEVDDGERYDWICPECGVDFWGTGKLVKKRNTCL